MLKHFQFEVIKSGKWRRLDGSQPGDGENQDRPHLIPKTEKAMMFTGFVMLMGNGFSIGKILRDGSEDEFGFRFLKGFSQEFVEKNYGEFLDIQVEQF